MIGEGAVGEMPRPELEYLAVAANDRILMTIGARQRVVHGPEPIADRLLPSERLHGDEIFVLGDITVRHQVEACGRFSRDQRRRTIRHRRGANHPETEQEYAEGTGESYDLHWLLLSCAGG